MSDDFFDTIKRLPKKTKRVSYSINEEVVNEFNKISEHKKYNKSKIVENFLREFIKMEKSLI